MTHTSTKAVKCEVSISHMMVTSLCGPHRIKQASSWANTIGRTVCVSKKQQCCDQGDFPYGVQSSAYSFNWSLLVPARVPFFCIDLLLSSPLFHFSSHSFSLSLFFMSPSPCCANAGGEKKLQHQCWVGFKAGVGGGGVHYAWPPTHPLRSMACIQILNTCS